MNLLSLYDFKKLDGLSPTINSTFIKLEEEKGEVAQIVGKLRRMSGEKGEELDNLIIYERLLEELMDITQVCATMIYILKDYFNINLDDVEFNIDESCSSFTYVLKNIAIIQGKISSYIYDIEGDNFVNEDLANILIYLFLNICKLSCGCIYYISNKVDKNLNEIKSIHVEKLIKRGYLTNY